MLTQKRRKRRRMLRERSPSPPMIRNKRQTPSPRLALTTRYSPDEMNNSPNFEEKKKFLTIFSLTHVSAEKRKGEAWPWPLGQSSLGWLRAWRSCWDPGNTRALELSIPFGSQGSCHLLL